MSPSPPGSSFRAFLDLTRARVEQALDEHLPRPPACPEVLSEALRYSVLAGGKRLRPILTLAAADAVSRAIASGEPGAPQPDAQALALPAACAIELIHTYSLIHDDLPSMDNDTLRRGRPTLHVVYGDGIAVLAGDALQAEAFALLSREPADEALASRKLRVIEVVARAAGATGMVGGQAIDLQAAGQVQTRALTLDAASLQGMHLKKTGALIRASAVCGAIMAGASHDIVGHVDRWAEHVGLAFQIVDDILDVEGNAVELGKTAGKDAAGEKPTYPALFGLERAREMAERCARDAQQILEQNGLADGWLPSMAEWVVARKT